MSYNQDEILKKIVVARIKGMSPNVKIALGSTGGFLGRNELLAEVTNGTPTGRKIVDIQLRYMQALKKGIV